VLTVIGRVSDATRASLVAEFGPAVRVLGPVDEAALERAYQPVGFGAAAHT
jgi:hypothetical protein